MRFSSAAAPFFDLIGQFLDGVRPTDRIDRIRHAGFGRNDLLCPQRQARCFFRRKRKGFIAAVAVERLRSAEDRRHRLNGDPDDVVVGLLSGQRAAAVWV